MKKLIKIFLICTLMLLALCVTASAATEGYYTYEVSNDEATITNVDTSIAGEVTIPSTLGGYPVTTIGENAFYWCTGLTSVEIGDSVTTIGGYAFDYCGKLTSIEVSENNSNYCSDNGILFSKSKETLVYYPVGKKDASYIIPESVTTIGRKAFYNCDSLTSIEIPGSVTIIGEEAFNYCDVLTSVVIPDSVTTIGDLAFSCCGSLTSIEVSENNFNYCSDNGILFSKNKETLICYPSGKSNTSYTVANGVTTIGGGLFQVATI